MPTQQQHSLDLQSDAPAPLWPDVGEFLGDSRSTAYERARRGEIETIRLGRKLLVPKWWLRQLIGWKPEQTQTAGR
jgi:hypothetical protein